MDALSNSQRHMVEKSMLKIMKIEAVKTPWGRDLLEPQRGFSILSGIGARRNRGRVHCRRRQNSGASAIAASAMTSDGWSCSQAV